MNEPAAKTAYANILPGDPAPWFRQRTSTNPRYVFDTAAGRYVVLGFYGSASDPVGADAIRALLTRRPLFDDENFVFFGVSVDPRDETEGRVRDDVPGVRYFWDFDGAVSRAYGALPVDAAPAAGQPLAYRRFWMVLDPTLRVMAVFPLAAGGADALFAFIDALPPPGRFAGLEMQAPVLFLPNVFEPGLCERLIAEYVNNGGEESGFMREIDGKTVAVTDYNHKRRKDHILTDQSLVDATRARIIRRVVPEIRKVHQFTVTRMERYIVSCYSAADGGHFNAHRDNTTKGTAHRRFAVSINLNGDFEGGEVWFPEYGRRRYKPPPGGAVVFSCSLLHAASVVTSGLRFAFLPFLYDEAAAKEREANTRFVEGDLAAYKA